MHPEPAPIADPHSTSRSPAENNLPPSARSSLRTLFWGVIGFMCLGLDAFLLIMLVFFELPYARERSSGYMSSPFFPTLLLTSVVLLLTWFSLRECFRRE